MATLPQYPDEQRARTLQKLFQCAMMSDMAAGVSQGAPLILPGVPAEGYAYAAAAQKPKKMLEQQHPAYQHQYPYMQTADASDTVDLLYAAQDAAAAQPSPHYYYTQQQQPQPQPKPYYPYGSAAEQQQQEAAAAAAQYYAQQQQQQQQYSASSYGDAAVALPYAATYYAKPAAAYDGGAAIALPYATAAAAAAYNSKPDAIALPYAAAADATYYPKPAADKELQVYTPGGKYFQNMSAAQQSEMEDKWVKHDAAVKLATTGKLPDKPLDVKLVMDAYKTTYVGKAQVGEIADPVDVVYATIVTGKKPVPSAAPYAAYKPTPADAYPADVKVKLAQAAVATTTALYPGPPPEPYPPVILYDGQKGVATAAVEAAQQQLQQAQQPQQISGPKDATVTVVTFNDSAATASTKPTKNGGGKKKPLPLQCADPMYYCKNNSNFRTCIAKPNNMKNAKREEFHPCDMPIATMKAAAAGGAAPTGILKKTT